jgi:sulfur transfer protein SufE
VHDRRNYDLQNSQPQTIEDVTFQHHISPERLKALRQIGGRIVQENEVKLVEAIDQNDALRELY